MSSVRQPQVISLKNNIAVQELSSSTDKRPLFIKQGECYHKVSTDAILYIESDNVYINVYTAERKYFVRSTIDQYLDLIQQNNFIRVHRSYAVNINHIDAIHAHDIKIGDRLIPVSRSNKTELLGKLRIG